MTDRKLNDRGERASARKAPTNVFVGKCRLARYIWFELFAFPAGSETLPWARSIAPGSGRCPARTTMEVEAKQETPRRERSVKDG